MGSMTWLRGSTRSASALAVVLAGCGGHAAQPAPRPAPPTRLVVVGDSAQIAARALPSGGDVAVVEAGTNDFISQTPRTQFAADYKALLAKVVARKVVCLTTWAPKDAVSGLKIPASFYDATIKQVCDDVVDLTPIANDPALRAGDGFHPNSAGHAAIARAIEGRVPSE
jgi:lysophospholipase L1-like esterase